MGGISPSLQMRPNLKEEVHFASAPAVVGQSTAESKLDCALVSRVSFAALPFEESVICEADAKHNV